jgi:hypothetical protein
LFQSILVWWSLTVVPVWLNVRTVMSRGMQPWRSHTMWQIALCFHLLPGPQEMESSLLTDLPLALLSGNKSGIRQSEKSCLICIRQDQARAIWEARWRWTHMLAWQPMPPCLWATLFLYCRVSTSSGVATVLKIIWTLGQSPIIFWHLGLIRLIKCLRHSLNKEVILALLERSLTVPLILINNKHAECLLPQSNVP